jgi:aspartyl-tRNA synthetase
MSSTQRTYIGSLAEHVHKEVRIEGFVHVARDQGKMAFFDFRDRTGTVQGVVFGKPEVLEVAKRLRSEWVVAVTGVVNPRPEKMVNAGVQNGTIELEITKIEVLSEAQTPPFAITESTAGIDESVRMKYRYLDLRTQRMQENLRIRSDFVQYCREYLFGQNFSEIETPLLSQSTPEGSRDFVVPSRLSPGKFYALPQSPQQYKQMLMVGGFERYFQIAKCMRDEDLRADRGFEFTQIDIEMAFVNQEMVMQTIEDMVTTAVEKLGRTIKQKPFPRITYADAMRIYGADKFDMRTEEEKAQGILAYAWVIDFPFFEKTDAGTWTFTHNPFSMPKAEHLEWLMAGKNIGEILTTQYDLVCNGYESGGGSIRAHRPEILRATYAAMGYTDAQIEASVGHMLEAFTYGAPPHGGIALGVERNIMNLTNESYVREVQAFPMTRGGQTAVMNAPSELTPEQLAELRLSVLRPPTKEA